MSSLHTVGVERLTIRLLSHNCTLSRSAEKLKLLFVVAGHVFILGGKKRGCGHPRDENRSAGRITSRDARLDKT